MDMENRLSRWQSGLLPLMLLMVSLALNVYLGLQLKKNSSESRGRPEDLHAIGQEMPNLQAFSATDQPRSLIFKNGGRETVLYVFTPTCIWCKRNLANAIAVEKASGTKFEFIGLSLVKEGVKDYVSQPRHLNGVVYLDTRGKGASPLVEGTPETFVIGSDGKIEKIWHGAYVGSNESEIEKFFDISLPGVQSVPETPEN